MSLPTFPDLNTAVNNIFAALSASKTRGNARSAIQSLQEVLADLKRAYAPDVSFVVTDNANATLASFFTGELKTAQLTQNRPLEVGFVFQVGGSGDTLNDALLAAKGSAVALNDIFEVTNTSVAAVAWIGNAGAGLDFTAEVFTQ